MSQSGAAWIGDRQLTPRIVGRNRGRRSHCGLPVSILLGSVLTVLSLPLAPRQLVPMRSAGGQITPPLAPAPTGALPARAAPSALALWLSSWSPKATSKTGRDKYR